MKLFPWMDNLPSDGAVTRLLTNLRDISLLYFSFTYLIAPFETWTAIVLAIAVPISVFIWWKYNARFWLSGLVLIISIVAAQTLLLLFSNKLTYYVECDAFVSDCFHTRHASILNEDVRIVPFNSLFTWPKRFLTRSVIGAENFDGSLIQSTTIDGEPRLQSPIESSVFEYFGGNSILGGVQMPYSLSPEYRTLSILSGVGYRTNGDRFLKVGFNTSLNTLTASEQREVFKSSLGSEKDFSFFSAGDPTSLDTWLRAVRNDLWLQRLPEIPTSELIARLESDGTTFRANEFLVLESMKLFVRCRNPATPERLIGCRSRLSEVVDARDRLPGNKDWTSGFVDPMLDAVAQGSSLQIDEDYLFDIGYSSPSSANGSPSDSESQARVLSTRASVSTDQLADLAGPTDRAMARAELENNLLSSFPNTLASINGSNSKCSGQQVLLLYGAMARLSSSNASETYSQIIANCIDEQRGSLHEHMLQDDDAFENALKAALSAMNIFERRTFAFDVALEVEAFQRQLTSIHFRETWDAVGQLFSTSGQSVLYSAGLPELVTALRTRYLEAILLDSRRNRLLDQFNDASTRVEDFLLQSFVDDKTTTEFWRSAAEVTDQFLAAVQTLKADYPEPSLDLPTDFNRLLQGSDLTQDAVTSLVDQLAFGIPSEITTDVQLVAALDTCFAVLTDAMLDAAFKNVHMILFDDFDALRQFMEGVSNSCFEPAQFIAFVVDEENSLFDPESFERFQADFPELTDYLLPGVEGIDLTDLGDGWQAAITTFVIEEVGNAALGLQLVDWELTRENRQNPDMQGVNQYWDEEEILSAKETLCGFWGDIGKIERALIDRRKLWKHSGILVSLARIQSLCDPNGRWLVETTLLEAYGAKILESVDRYRITPLQTSLLEFEIPQSISVISNLPSTRDQRSAAASFGLLRYKSQTGVFADEDDEPDAQEFRNLFVPLMFPARSDLPESLKAGQAYLDAAEELLTHADLEVRQAILDFFVGEAIEPVELINIISGEDTILEGGELTTAVALLEVLRATLPEAAGTLATIISEFELNSLQRTSVVDTLIDNDELEEAASQILLIPSAEISFSASSRWTSAFLDDDGRLRLNRPILLRALIHMRN